MNIYVQYSGKVQWHYREDYSGRIKQYSKVKQIKGNKSRGN